MNRKKILLIHTRYRSIGGEDIAFINELNFLSEYFHVENVVFSNENLKLKDYFYLFFNNNRQSAKILEKKINKFQPDFAYVHNTWFKGSLSIFKVLSKKNIPTILKLHNTRYNCTNSYFTKKHFYNFEVCKSCGQTKKSYGYFNKYYKDSYLRSFLINNYGRKYLKLLKNNKFKILVLSQFHKDYLSKFGVAKNKIFIFPNYIKKLKTKNTMNIKSNHVIYAGRISIEKGISDLIRAWDEQKIKDQLIIAGTGPEKFWLEKKIKFIDNISYVGEITNDESIKLISSSKCVISATQLLEGQPTLFCEASSVGIPSIYPSIGGIESFFPTNSKLSFESGNIESLKQAISHLSDDKLLKKEGERNKKFIDQYLNEENLLKIFQKILDA